MSRERLNQTRQGERASMQWGPHLSERQWGTVREDHSESGEAWNYFAHDQARSRAYRWGENGIAGSYEYFHGDNDAGIGASHRTGWTGLVAKLIQLFGSIDADGYLPSCGALMPLVAPMPEKATA